MLHRVKLIRLHLLGGAGYFLIAALLHYTGTKFFGFYVFYDLPTEAYQDRIIAVLALGWGAMYVLSAKDPLKYFDLTNLLVIIGFIGLSGTAGNIWLTDFSQFPGFTGTWSYWVQVFGLVFYLVMLGSMNLSLIKVQRQQTA